jgi:hypothetical protein
MSKHPIKHNRVRIIDIDGTVLLRRAPHEYNEEPTLLENAAEVINHWFDQGDFIVMWTARSEEYYEKTFTDLETCGVKFHELIMEKPYSHEIHIYDDKDIFFHKVERDVGLGLLKDPDNCHTNTSKDRITFRFSKWI